MTIRVLNTRKQYCTVNTYGIMGTITDAGSRSAAAQGGGRSAATGGASLTSRRRPGWWPAAGNCIEKAKAWGPASAR